METVQLTECCVLGGTIELKISTNPIIKKFHRNSFSKYVYA